LSRARSHYRLRHGTERSFTLAWEYVNQPTPSSLVRRLDFFPKILVTPLQSSRKKNQKLRSISKDIKYGVKLLNASYLEPIWILIEGLETVAHTHKHTRTKTQHSIIQQTNQHNHITATFITYSSHS
jgi:hypothetical protein